MTWIKICGITNLEDGKKAASLGVDALGFIFAPSPRKIDPILAHAIIRYLPASIIKVGVFVNQSLSEVKEIAAYCGLDTLQFHGDESPMYCKTFFLPVIKALRMKNSESLKEVEKYHHVTLLLDTYSPVQAGGTGSVFPWEIAGRLKGKKDFVLSGGLTPSNIGKAIQTLKPWGVDVCSGVEESSGKKDLLNMKDFIKEVRKADEQDRSNIQTIKK